MEAHPGTATFRVRRATTEDIRSLTALWEMMRYPSADLARRVTEFQVVQDAAGGIIGAVALEILGHQGRVHSEGFLDFSVADQVRPLLWERISMLSSNLALLNIWTTEEAPFWRQNGFREPTPELLAKFPPQWKSLHGKWSVLKLREEVEALLSADKEFAVFMQAEKARTQRAIQRAGVFKTLATVLAAILLVSILMAGLYLVRYYRR